MKDDLILKKIRAWAVDSSDSETTSSIKGYYTDQSVAHKKAEKSGWYGSNGIVKEVNNIYTDGVNLYQIKVVGQTEEMKRKEAELKAQALSKLTEEEKEILGLKH